MSDTIDITPEDSVCPVVLEPSTSKSSVDLLLGEPDTDELRRESYRDISDPLFFKWQRGEATEQEWLDAVEDIRNQFPA